MNQTDKSDNSDDGIVVEIDSRYASAWPEVKGSLGLNPAGPDDVGGVGVLDVDKSDDGYFTNGVTLRFEDVAALERATERLFEQASEMFEYGIQGDAGDVQDFASYALPSAHEVENAE